MSTFMRERWVPIRRDSHAAQRQRALVYSIVRDFPHRMRRDVRELAVPRGIERGVPIDASDADRALIWLVAHGQVDWIVQSGGNGLRGRKLYVVTVESELIGLSSFERRIEAQATVLAEAIERAIQP